MTFVDWVVIILYLGCVISVGRYFARRQRNTQDYFIGGGRMPWLAVALSVVASLASTVGYLGTPGEVVRYGAGILIPLAGIPLAFVVIILLIVPFYKRAGVTTAFELLGNRYGWSTRLLGVAVWAYMQVAFLGLVLLLASRLIADMTGVPDVAVIVVIGLASVLYTSAGGMQSVVWTDVIQFAILFLGAVVVLAVIAVYTGTGPAEWWREVAGRTHQFPPLASRDLATRHTVLGTMFFGFVVNIAYACSEQVVVQRYAATARAVAMMWANYGAGVAFTVLQIAVGAAILVFYIRTPGALPAGVQAVTDPGFADRAFPHFIVHHLPVGLTGLVIAALLGAAQSTLDSGVNSMAAVTSKDVLPALGRSPTAGHELRVARWTTRGVGVGVVIMAIAADNLPGSNNIVDVAQKVVHLGMGPLCALFLVAMFVKYVGKTAANAALILGLVSAVWFAFAEVIPGRPIISPILIIPVSWLVTFAAAMVLGLFHFSRNRT